jgi:acyl carrier protein
MQQYAEQDVQTIKEILGRLLNQENIADQDDIYEAGLTSIMVLPLLSEIEETFGLTVPDNEFLDARTPAALAEMVQRLRGT